jgi:predicted nucleotide-binding protein
MHSTLSRKVFVVHGHDEAAKETVARFLERIDLVPIILHEQIDLNRTIIEKFEDNADVAYAVVLLTPDDVGASKLNPQNQMARPRQNVIFELGYFIGRLGRKKVCALKKGDIEILSDQSGVLYREMDQAGSWKIRLAREINAAGITVDLAKAAVA